MPSPTAHSVPPSSLTFNTIVNGRAVPRITRLPEAHVLWRATPFEQTALSAEAEVGLAIAGGEHELAHARAQAHPVTRLFTGTAASMPSSTAPSGLAIPQTRSERIRFAVTLMAEMLVSTVRRPPPRTSTTESFACGLRSGRPSERKTHQQCEARRQAGALGCGSHTSSTELDRCVPSVLAER
jgi:hypothetical protein